MIIIDTAIRLPRPHRRARQIPAEREQPRRWTHHERYWADFTQVLAWDEEEGLHVEETDRMHGFCPPRRGGPVVAWRVLREVGL